MRIKKIVYIHLFAFLFFSCNAQKVDNNLDKSLTPIYKNSNFPGFAITIIRNDSVLFSKSYGFANKEKKIPYTLETLQPIGSVSKTFIALALIKSVELGYFTLETDINTILPFKVTNPNFPTSSINVNQLATHTSSLLDNEETYYKVGYQLGNKPTIELGAFLKDYYSKSGKYYSTKNFDLSPIGSNYSYSNIAASLMAYIIEIKSRMSFADFTKKYIFEPLKMNSTDWFYNKMYENKCATLYQVNGPESELERIILNTDKSLKPYCCVTYPDGSLRSSANELTLYLKEMMKGYFTNDSTIIKNKFYKKMFEKQFNEKNMPTNMDFKEPNRGIFWAYSKRGDIRHTGSDAGVFAFVSFNPTTKIGRVMTLNASLEGGENKKTVGYFKKIIEELDKFEGSLK